MRRVLGVVDGFRTEGAANEQLLVQDGSAFNLIPGVSGEADIFLTTLLRERNERVGNGSAKGDGVFDFRYGPFTGGLGETGLLHLSTYGEKILGVEIDLSVKHRGIESSIAGVDPALALRLAERVCGNFAFAGAHALAMALEGLLGTSLSEVDRLSAVVALELERVYNHLHVIMRLAEAAAQKVLAAHLGALFERVLRINRAVTGSRYLLGARVLGSMRVSPKLGGEAVIEEVRAIRREFAGLYASSLSSRNYLDRLHNIAVVSGSTAAARSLTGPSLRACGIGDDLRRNDPFYPDFVPALRSEGDSLARMEVRAEEILASLSIIEGKGNLFRGSGPGTGGKAANEEGVRGPVSAAKGRGAGFGLPSAIGAAEGPSGLTVWVVELEHEVVRRAYVSTPSLFGYQVFAEALTGHIFTDFPFALDSFGLSFADAAR